MKRFVRLGCLLPTPEDLLANPTGLDEIKMVIVEMNKVQAEMNQVLDEEKQERRRGNDQARDLPPEKRSVYLERIMGVLQRRGRTAIQAKWRTDLAQALDARVRAPPRRHPCARPRSESRRPPPARRRSR